MKSNRLFVQICIAGLVMACLTGCRHKVHIGLVNPLYPITLATVHQDIRWVSETPFTLSFRGVSPCLDYVQFQKTITRGADQIPQYTAECGKPDYGFYLYDLAPGAAKDFPLSRTKVESKVTPATVTTGGPGVMIAVDGCKHNCPKSSLKAQDFENTKPQSQQPIALYCETNSCASNPHVVVDPAEDRQVSGQQVQWQNLGQFPPKWTITFTDSAKPCLEEKISNEKPFCTTANPATDPYSYKAEFFNEKGEKIGSGDGKLVVTNVAPFPGINK